MAGDTLISVIIPIYKVEEYLHECVDSVLTQSYTSLEVILVDDGSPDNCPTICDRYATQDSRVKVIHKANGGLSDARNAGLKEATGEYVVFLDSDDYWDDTEAVSSAVEILHKQQDIDLLYFNYTYVSPSKYVANPEVETALINDKPKIEALGYLIENDRLRVTAWSKFARRNMLVDNEILFKKGLLSEDYDWNFSILIHCRRIYFMDRNFYRYRMREGSITSKLSTKHLFDICSIVRDWYVKIPQMVAQSSESGVYLDLLAFIYGLLLSRIYLCDTKSNRTQLINEMRPYISLLKRDRSRKMRVVATLYRIFGFNLSWRILGWVDRCRGLN